MQAILGLNQSAFAQTTILKRQDIEASSAQTLAELLQNVPGIDALPVTILEGEPADEYHVRGVYSPYSTRLLLLVDGRLPLNDLIRSSPWLSNEIPTDIIERLEVYIGDVPSRFKFTGAGAVINLVTRADSNSAKAWGGSYGERGLLLSSAILVGTDSNESDEVSDEASNQDSGANSDVEDADQDTWLFSSLVTGRQNRGQTEPEFGLIALDSSRSIHNSDRVRDGTKGNYNAVIKIESPQRKWKNLVWLSYHQPHPLFTNSVATPIDDPYKYVTEQYLLSSSLKIDSHLRANLRAGLMRWDWIGPDDENSSLRADPDLNFSSLDQLGLTFESQHLGGELEYERKTTWGSVAAGVDYDIAKAKEPRARYNNSGTLVEDSSPNKTTFSEHLRHTFRSYLSSEVSLLRSEEGAQFSIKPKIQYWYTYDRLGFFNQMSYPEKRIGLLVPELTMEWQINDRNTFSLSGLSAHRAPSTLELAGTPLRRIAGNYNLTSEKERTLQLEWEHKLSPGSHQTIQVTSFYTTLRDQVTKSIDEDLGSGLFLSNSGKTEVYGGSASLKLNRFWFNTTATKSRVTDPDEDRTHPSFFVSDFHFNSGVHFFLHKLARANLEFSYRSPRLFSDSFSGRSEVKGDLFFLLSLNANYQFTHNALLSVKLKNLLNQKYKLPLDVSFPGSREYIYRGFEFLFFFEYSI